MGTYYYRRDSGGAFTNLQMYSRHQAREYWRELEAEYSAGGEHTHQLKERCAFIVSTFGLSVSQLLGQNNPAPKKERVAPPVDVFEQLAAEHGIDPELVKDFERFNEYYEDIRHFGVTPKGTKHERLDSLTFTVTRECVLTAERVWRAVIEVHKRDLGAKLDELDLDFDEEILGDYPDEESDSFG